MRIFKIVILITLAVAILCVVWIVYLNSPYIADISACRIESPNCSTEPFTAKVNYDSMDGVYVIQKLRTQAGEIPLKECVVKKSTGYSAICEDEKGQKWNILLAELRM